jgi:hypothetical protein
MQRTATRCAITLSMIKTLPLDWCSLPVAVADLILVRSNAYVSSIPVFGDTVLLMLRGHIWVAYTGPKRACAVSVHAR